MTDASQEFRAAMCAHGLKPPEQIIPGKLHRFSASGKRGDDAAWCRLFEDGTGGVFGDWRSGLSESWQARRGRPLSQAERDAFARKYEAARLEREADEARGHADARSQAERTLKESTAATDHPYLRRKGIGAHGAKLHNGALVLPMRDSGGTLHSLQIIDADGGKRFLPGGKVSGCYFAIGKPNGALYIAEGFATAASIHEATGGAVAVAFNAGNLLPVASALRSKYPGVRLTVCADDDVDTPGNPGLTKATAAAMAVDGLLAVPDFGEARPEGASDFNDLANARGQDAVRACLDAAKPVESPESTHADVPMPTHSPRGLEAPEPVHDAPRIVAIEIAEVLVRDFPPKEPFLAPWLRRQDLAMVYAKRGVGKTHFCLALAYAVASGGRFLNWSAPTPRRVLYIDGEMPGATIKDRLAALAGSQEAEPPEGYFRIVTPDIQQYPLPDLATKAGQDALAPIIGDAELIVLDNLSSLMRAGVENEGEAWVPMADWALARRREGRAVLFVHHAGKGGQQRGSSRREDLLDLSILLKHPGDYDPEQGARFEVVFEKARGLFGDDVQRIEATLTQGDAGPVWTWRKAEGATADRVLELHAMGMKPGEIAADLGIDRATAYRALKRAGVNLGDRKA